LIGDFNAYRVYRLLYHGLGYQPSSHPGFARGAIMKTNPRRLELVKLSRAFKPLVEAGKFAKVNDAIVAYYTQQTGKTDWHTFKGWKDAGFSVVKGATGFPIWAQPRALGEGKAQDTAPAEPADSGEGPQWFPVCYLFHDGQVQAIESVRAAA